jgi:hypothetical protein
MAAVDYIMAIDAPAYDPNFSVIGARKYFLFNADFYLAQLPDPSIAAHEPRAHYNDQGWKLGLDPSIYFDTLAYLAANPDVAAAEISPLDHYINVGMAQFKGFGGVPDESGYIIDVDEGVAANEVADIKAGLVIADTFFSQVVGRDIPEEIRAHITVKIEATGQGNQDPSGYGAVATGLYAQNDLLPRPYFDVGNTQWSQPSDWKGWTTVADNQKTIVHEYTHGWLSWFAGQTIYEQPLGNWMNEGLSEFLAYSAMAYAGHISRADADAFMQFSSVDAGQMAIALDTINNSGTWPGHVGYVAISWLVDESGKGFQAILDLADGMTAARSNGGSLGDVFVQAFDIHLVDFYRQFDVWRLDILADPDLAFASRPNLINLREHSVLQDSAGDQHVDGGPGRDILDLAGPRSSYSVFFDQDGFVAVGGPDGTKTTENVEVLKFSDSSYNLTIGKQAQQIDPGALNSLIDLYVAYFNRVPEAGGLAYWIDPHAAGKSLTTVAAEFYAAGIQFSDVTGYTADMPLSDFIKVLYANVLGRNGSSAPPQEDIDYWLDQVATGAVTREGMVARFLDDARLFYDDPNVGWVPRLLDQKASSANCTP